MSNGRPAVRDIAATIAGEQGLGRADHAVLTAGSVRRVDGQHTNQLWRAESEEGPVVIKVSVGQQADGAEREWRFLNLFADALPGHSPAPLLFDRNSSLIAMEGIAGEPLADARLTAEQVDSIAEWLSTGHRASRDSDGLPKARTAPAMLVPRTRLAWSVARETRTGDPIVDEAMAAAEAWMDRGELDGLLALPADVITRGDTNLANCLWDGDTVRMVDFEDAGWNSRVVEIGDYIEHIRGKQNDEAVWDGMIEALELTKDERALLRTVCRRFALWWLMMLLPGGRAADRNPPEALAEQAERLLALLNPA